MSCFAAVFNINKITFVQKLICMKLRVFYLATYLLVSSVAFFSCKKTATSESVVQVTNEVEYADGFEMYAYPDFTIVKVTRPWPNATNTFQYVLKPNDYQLPDSLSRYTVITVPIQEIVVTSTTHLPALDLLEVVPSLVGFPGLDYVSSEVIRKKIDQGTVRELGQQEQLNTELLMDLNPNVLVAFGMDGNNKTLESLSNAGIPILYNGDWAEQTALGKAEWLKLFGALYGKEAKAKELFDEITENYLATIEKLKTVTEKPTVISGAMYQDVWYMPEGKSWVADYFNQAKTDYLWKDTQGTGSLALSFEAVYDKGQDAAFWINPAQYESLDEMRNANPHYANFKAFKTGEVYSFSGTKGKTGGVLFYELGPTRPDLILKDLASILHPEVFPDHKRVFYKKLK